MKVYCEVVAFDSSRTVLTTSSKWEISLKGPTVFLVQDSLSPVAGAVDPGPVTISRRLLWSTVIFRPMGGPAIFLGGIPNASVKEMLIEVQTEHIRLFALIDARRKVERFDALVIPVIEWARRVAGQIHIYGKRKWFPQCRYTRKIQVDSK